MSLALPDPIENAMPAGALRLVRRIREAGGRVCIVGGSLRDLMLGLEVHDWDFATDLVPHRVAELFPRAIQVGIRFGTVLIVQSDGSYEVTTFRREGTYSDARHPDSVVFTTSIEEDLCRRDFTVNAMALDLANGALIDPHDGRRDLEERTIRCVGRADERFQEDALRMLRCVRIAGQLDFSIAEETYRALPRCAPLLDAIARERIREEFDRILGQPRPSVSLERLHETGLLDRFLPELSACYGVSQNRFHAFDVFYHSLLAVDQAPADNRVVRLSALLHDLGKVDARREEPGGHVTFYNHQAWSARKAESILRRLRYPNEDRKRIVHLVQQHMFHYNTEWTDSAVRRFVRTIGTENLDDLFAARRADTLGNGLRRSAASAELTELRRRIAGIIEKDTAFSVRDLDVDGDALKQTLGVREGPVIGKILDALLEEVLEDPARNARDRLLARAGEILPDIEANLPPRRKRRED